MIESIPEFVLDGLTTRQWKALKRQQLKAVDKALNEYRLGCAYCPGYFPAVSNIQSGLDQIKRLQSVKLWGR